LFAASVFLLGCGSASKPATPQFPQVAGLARRQVQFQQTVYSFYVFAPSSYDGCRPLPAVLLIHGGGGNGSDLIGAWKNSKMESSSLGQLLPLGGAFETAVAPQLYPMIMGGAR
jgi:hypothetical protein